MTSQRHYGVQLLKSDRLALARHPDAPRREPWKAWAQRQSELGPVAVDLFSGAGGLSRGLEDAGFRTVLAVDHDPMAVETHLANFAGPCLDLDLSQPDRIDDLIELLANLRIDLLAGGPPCQPFSRAGRSKIRDLVERGVREALDPRRELWRAFLTVAEAVQPRAILMENVPDMALGDDMRTVRFMADRLETLGYETDMRIVEAWRHGVPQHRQRLIFVAIKGGVFEWPKDSEPVHLRDAIGDLPSLRGTTGARLMRYRGPRSPFQVTAREGLPEESHRLIHDHMTRAVRDDDREAFKLMRPGTRYSDLPPELKRYRDDIFDDKYHRLAWKDVSRSITAHIAKDGYWYIHPREHRTLTVREAARIQTFPDSFRFAGTRSDAFKQIGNAVPPRLGRVMGEAILWTLATVTAEVCPPSQRRAKARALIIEWQGTRGDALLSAGEPWRVLVGTMAGSRNRHLAERILEAAPCAASYTPRVAIRLIKGAKDDRSSRVLHDLIAVAKIMRKGWDRDAVGAAGRLGPAALDWVEAVGLNAKHVVATTGAMRVAGRLDGDPGVSGVSGRMILARLIGHTELSARITAGLSGLATEVCTKSNARCGECPLASLCASASSPAVTISG